MFSVAIRAASLRISGLRFVQHASRPPVWSSCRQFRVVTALRSDERVNVAHARFLTEKPQRSRGNGRSSVADTEDLMRQEEDSESLIDGRGKLTPTSSHLFKLILPLDRLQAKAISEPGPPTVFLLHPSQPLSHVSRLVASSFSGEPVDITFRISASNGKQALWSDSTDIADFIHDAARATQFEIHLKRDSGEKSLQVEVPTFADRTRFLRRRLDNIQRELKAMEQLKQQCDLEAHRGARRMATGGLAMLITYWAAVARLTFWDLGWDIMEPVTYLSGLSMVILGYLWFLYQGREVSYSSVLSRSISARRQSLYEAHGFDIERWAELTSEAKSLRREISKIAEDYDEREAQKSVEMREEENTEKPAE